MFACMCFQLLLNFMLNLEKKCLNCCTHIFVNGYWTCGCDPVSLLQTPHSLLKALNKSRKHYRPWSSTCVCNSPGWAVRPFLWPDYPGYCRPAAAVSLALSVGKACAAKTGGWKIIIMSIWLTGGVVSPWKPGWHRSDVNEVSGPEASFDITELWIIWWIIPEEPYMQNILS